MTKAWRRSIETIKVIKRCTFPETTRITGVLVLALLVLSCFLPVLVNPGTVHADDSSVKLADPATLPAGNGKSAAFNYDSTYMAVVHESSPYFTIYKKEAATDDEIGFCELTGDTLKNSSTCAMMKAQPQ